jgi:hypothetical protein
MEISMMQNYAISSLAYAARTYFLSLPPTVVCRRLYYFLLVQKVIKKDTTPKDTAILLSHGANHTNFHAKFCVRAGRGLPTPITLAKDNI